MSYSQDRAAAKRELDETVAEARAMHRRGDINLADARGIIECAREDYAAEMTRIAACKHLDTPGATLETED